MFDQYLNDHRFKLVRYTVASLERGAERILPGAENRLVAFGDPMTRDEFKTWVIGSWARSEEGREGLPEERYLRVHFEVLGRWCRPPLHIRFEPPTT